MPPRRPLLLPPAPSFLGGRNPAELHRRLQERSAELAAARSVSTSLGAWNDPKELRAASHLAFRLFGRAGRCWFEPNRPGVLLMGFYSGNRLGPVPVEHRSRQRTIMFEARTYSDLFELVTMWKAQRS